MKKDYQKPEVELITLAAAEPVTADSIIGGDMGDESNDDL